MSHIQTPPPAAAPAPDVRARVAACVGEHLTPVVEKIDHGYYPAAELRALGDEGLFAQHLSRHSPSGAADLPAAIDAMTSVGRACMATAFCTWCHDAAGWYLENTENAALRDRLQGDLASGAKSGGTGLSNPMKSLAQIEEFKLRAKRADGGWVVSGILPWVSNLGAGHWFGTVFVNADDPRQRIMAMIECGQPGVELRANAKFIALEGTGTYAVLFRKAFISDDQVLADPAEPMVRRIRPGFVLLQTGMALGVTLGCIDLMRESDRTHGHTNRYMDRRPDDFEADFHDLRARIMEVAEQPHETGPEHMRKVFTVRLNASELVLEAAQSAMLHAGARGYIEGSPQHRRLREAYFAAMVTPSIRHLRQELSKLAAA